MRPETSLPETLATRETMRCDLGGQPLIQELLGHALILGEDWEMLPGTVRDELTRCSDPKVLLGKMVEHKLLTGYQAARIESGKTYGLVLGNYRVLDRLGSGGMGIVFKAEHIRMRKLVAVKVLPISREDSARELQRFYAEIRSVAQLQHPNIVAAMDAGEVSPPDPDTPALHYFVMEYVEGQDLEKLVESKGPLSLVNACDLTYQIASALSEAHKHNLVHRDIKPSNVLVTADGQAKLLDFGLVRHFRRRLTEPGTVLGTIDYMAPEQARDASTVDIRADIYGLGGTLYWSLTGQVPFPMDGNITEQLAARSTRPAPSLRAKRQDVPPEFDAVVARMLNCNAEDRYATPQALMHALVPFLRLVTRSQVVAGPLEDTSDALGLANRTSAATSPCQILVVDDEAGVRNFCRFALQAEGLLCDEAADGFEALAVIRSKRYDLVLLDWAMPGMTGVELSRKLREDPPYPNLKIVMFSAHAPPEDLAQMLTVGVDDYLLKPFRVLELTARIKAALRLKEAQDRSDLLNRHLLTLNQQLDQTLNARDSDLVQVRNALVLALAKIVEHREAESSSHLIRLQRYARCLAEDVACLAAFAEQIDPAFIQMLECCAPLHDIGKVSLPDHILLKPGKLDPEERLIMQTHTLIGAETLMEVHKRHSTATAFLQMATDIARHHHERYDGKGYPDRLAGNDIPLAARLVAVCDVYDALRSRRPYRPALSHNLTLLAINEGSTGHFDPVLLEAFQRRAADFERIYRDLPD